MSKTKKIKQKTTGFDILYRVVTVIMAVAMYPLFYFLDLIYIQMDHTGIAEIISSLSNNSSTNLSVTYEQFSVPELIDLANTVKGFINEDTSFNLWSNSACRPLVIAIVFLAIALVLGVVILGFAAFSNKVKAITGLSGAGFVCTIVSFLCFSEGFAAPIINGDVSLAKLIGQDGNALLELVFSVVGEITFLNLESAFFAVMFLMLGILIWSIAVLVVNKSEEKEKAMKEAARSHR